MKSEKMWEELAKYYDLVYYWKPYEKEAKIIHELIKKHKKTKGAELLEIACGTGNHMPFLKKHYKITGTDLNPDMLKVAKKKFPKIKFQKANMVSFDLNKKFDVILCLFSSIGYIKNYKNLKKTIKNFSAHLKPGGVLIIEPFISKEAFVTKKPHAVFVDRPDIKISRMVVSERREDIAILNFHFLIASKKGVTYLRDKHELGLFDTKKFLEILRENDFKAKYLKNGLMKDRGLYVATKK